MFTAAGAAPDKPAGVVAITFTDLRRRGKIGKMVLVDAVGGARQILGARHYIQRTVNPRLLS